MLFWRSCYGVMGAVIYISPLGVIRRGNGISIYVCNVSVGRFCVSFF